MAVNFINLLDGQLDSLIDVLIIFALSVLIHTLKSRVASILLFAYGMFGFLYSLMAVHEATGWLLPLAGAVYRRQGMENLLRARTDTRAGTARILSEGLNDSPFVAVFPAVCRVASSRCLQNLKKRLK